MSSLSSIFRSIEAMANIDNADTDCGYFIDAVRTTCGDAGVNRVLEARGGVIVRLPLAPRANHWLSRAVGHINALKICAKISVSDADGRWIKYPDILLPLSFKASARKLVTKVDNALADGISVRKVAVLVGVSERTVWRRRALLIHEGKLTSGSSQDHRS